MSQRPRGPLPGWRPSTARQRGILADLVARFERHAVEDTLPRSPRGVFYDLRPAGMGNGITYRKPDKLHPAGDFDRDTEAHPAAVQEVLTLARRAGIIREEWVADTRAPEPLVRLAYADATDFARAVATMAEDFVLDAQDGQPVHVEVLCEAAGLAPRLARVAGSYGVPVFSGGGFDGLKGKRAFAERAMGRELPTVVIQIGDRDEHGERIYVSAAEDAIAWAGGRGRAWPPETEVTPALLASVRDEWDGHGPALLFIRLALTAAQAEDLDLLDENGKAEVDGVPVPVMDRLLTDAIEALQVPGRRDLLRDEERRQRERLPDALPRRRARPHRRSLRRLRDVRRRRRPPRPADRRGRLQQPAAERDRAVPRLPREGARRPPVVCGGP